MSSTTTARRLEAELAALGGSLRTRSKRTRTVAISTWARSSNPSIVDLTFLGGSHHQHPSDVDFDQEEYDGKYSKNKEKFGISPLDNDMEDRGGVGFLPDSASQFDSSSSSSSSSTSSVTVVCPGFIDGKEYLNDPIHDTTTSNSSHPATTTTTTNNVLNGRVSARVDDAFEIVPGVVLLRELKLSQPSSTRANQVKLTSSLQRLSSMNEGVFRAVEEPLSQWLHGFDSAVLLVGQRGTGKSTLAYGAPALLPSGVVNRSILAGGGVVEGGGVNGGYSHYSISGGKGRPSLCGVVIDSALSHVRASNNRYESLRSKSQNGLYSMNKTNTNVNSSSGSSSASLCISMWSVSCEDDSIRDLLNRFSPSSSSSSSSSSGIISSSPLSFNDFSPIKVSVKTEEEARRVIASGLVRCGSFEAMRMPASSSSTSSSSSSLSPNRNKHKSMDVLMPLPSMSHVFVSFELTSSLDIPLLNPSSTLSSVLLQNDLSAVGSLTRRTFTLVDLAGAPTASAVHPSNGGNPTLRVRSLEQRAYAMLPTQLLSLDRLIEEVASAQRAAGILMTRNTQHKHQQPQQSQSERTIQSQLAATNAQQQQRRGQDAFTFGQKREVNVNKENSSPTSSPPLFRVDRNNNDPHGPGIGGGSVGKRFSSSSASSNKTIGLHLRDTLLSRSLAPLIGAGNVLVTVIGTVSSSKSDEANNKSTLRLLSSIGRIVAHAVRNDILAPLEASRSINNDDDNSIYDRRNEKVMKLKRRSGVLTAEEWWDEHGYKITETLPSSLSSNKRPHHSSRIGQKSESNDVDFDILHQHQQQNQTFSYQSQAIHSQSAPLSPPAPPFAAAPSVAATAFGAAFKSELEHHQALVGGALAATEERERRERDAAQQRDTLLAIEAMSEAAIIDADERDARRRAPASRAITSSSSSSSSTSSSIVNTTTSTKEPEIVPQRAPATPNRSSVEVQVQTMPEPLTVLKPLSVDWRPSYYELSRRALDGTLSGGTIVSRKTMKDASTSSNIVAEKEEEETEKEKERENDAGTSSQKGGLHGTLRNAKSSETINKYTKSSETVNKSFSASNSYSNPDRTLSSSSLSSSSLLSETRKNLPFSGTSSSATEDDDVLLTSSSLSSTTRRSPPPLPSSQAQKSKMVDNLSMSQKLSSTSSLKGADAAVSSTSSSPLSQDSQGRVAASSTTKTKPSVPTSFSSLPTTSQSPRKPFPASSNSSYSKQNYASASALSTSSATPRDDNTLMGRKVASSSSSSSSPPQSKAKSSSSSSSSPPQSKAKSSSSSLSPSPTPIAVLLNSTTPQSAVELATRLSRSAIEEDEESDDEELLRIKEKGNLKKGYSGSASSTPKKSLLNLANSGRQSVKSTSKSPSTTTTTTTYARVGSVNGVKESYSSVSPAMNRSNSSLAPNIGGEGSGSGAVQPRSSSSPSSPSSPPFSPPPPLPPSSSSSSSAQQIASPTERSASRASVYASYLEHHIGLYYNEQPNTSSEEEEDEEMDANLNQMGTEEEEGDLSSIEFDEQGRKIHHHHHRHHNGSSSEQSSDNDRNTKLRPSISIRRRRKGDNNDENDKNDDDDNDDDDDEGYLSSQETNTRKLFNTAFPAQDLIKRSNKEREEDRDIKEHQSKKNKHMHDHQHDFQHDHYHVHRQEHRNGKPPTSKSSSDRDSSLSSPQRKKKIDNNSTAAIIQGGGNMNNDTKVHSSRQMSVLSINGENQIVNGVEGGVVFIGKPSREEKRTTRRRSAVDDDEEEKFKEEKEKTKTIGKKEKDTSIEEDDEEHSVYSNSGTDDHTRQYKSSSTHQSQHHQQDNQRHQHRQSYSGTTMVNEGQSRLLSHHRSNPDDDGNDDVVGDNDDDASYTDNKNTEYMNEEVDEHVRINYQQFDVKRRGGEGGRETRRNDKTESLSSRRDTMSSSSHQVNDVKKSSSPQQKQRHNRHHYDNTNTTQSLCQRDSAVANDDDDDDDADNDADDSYSDNAPLVISPLTPPSISTSRRLQKNHKILTSEINTRSNISSSINNVSGISSSSSRIGGDVVKGRSSSSGGGGGGGGGLLSPRTNARFAELDRDLQTEERRVESEFQAAVRHKRRTSSKSNSNVVIDGSNRHDVGSGLLLSKSSLEASVDALSQRLATLSSEVANITGRVKDVTSSEKRGKGSASEGKRSGVGGGEGDVNQTVLTESIFIPPPPSLSSSLSPHRASSALSASAFRLPLSPALIRYSSSRYHALGGLGSTGSGGGGGGVESSSYPLNASTSSSSSFSFTGDLASPSHARSAFSTIRDSPRSLLNAAAKARAFAASIRQKNSSSSSNAR
jgi:hypothetical protein